MIRRLFEKVKLIKPRQPNLQQTTVSVSLPDEKLLEYYNMGWHDCAENNKEKKFENKLIQRAYTIGWLDFIAGDDVSSVDMQTEQDILKHIKQ